MRSWHSLASLGNSSLHVCQFGPTSIKSFTPSRGDIYTMMPFRYILDYSEPLHVLIKETELSQALFSLDFLDIILVVISVAF